MGVERSDWADTFEKFIDYHEMDPATHPPLSTNHSIPKKDEKSTVTTKNNQV
jgi:hypothetical protein